jgi:hypothetical protein
MGCFVSKEAKLLEAVKSGDVAAARAALERGASVVCSPTARKGYGDACRAAPRPHDARRCGVEARRVRWRAG